VPNTKGNIFYPKKIKIKSPEKDFFTNQVNTGLGFWKELSQCVDRYNSLL